MKKPLIKNYTTGIPASKTIAEIQQILGENGAQGVATEYSNGRVTSVFFKIQYKNNQLAFRLPAKPKEVFHALFADMDGNYEGSMYFSSRMEKAENIAWRICKTWLEAQITLVNLEQAKIPEVFLPYMVVGENQTMYESMEQRQFLLPSGN